MREFHASILSESLFLSLLVVFLGLSIRFAHYPTWRLDGAGGDHGWRERGGPPHRLRASCR